MLAFKLETWEEAKVILIYHVVGTAMEVFKTDVGSWIYPEPSILPHRRRAAVLRLHVCGGRQLHRALLAAVRFSLPAAPSALVGPFAWRCDLYQLLRSSLHCGHSLSACSRQQRCCSRAPGSTTRSGACIGACRCCLALVWCRCSSGSPRTSARSRGPGSIRTRWSGWSAVSLGKLGSWFLLLIISYALVAAVNRPAAVDKQ